MYLNMDLLFTLLFRLTFTRSRYIVIIHQVNHNFLKQRTPESIFLPTMFIVTPGESNTIENSLTKSLAIFCGWCPITLRIVKNWSCILKSRLEAGAFVLMVSFYRNSLAMVNYEH